MGKRNGHRGAVVDGTRRPRRNGRRGTPRQRYYAARRAERFARRLHAA